MTAFRPPQKPSLPNAADPRLIYHYGQSRGSSLIEGIALLLAIFLASILVIGDLAK